MKTSAKYFGLAVGPSARQHEPKWPKNCFTYDVTHKKSKTPNKKNLFSNADQKTGWSIWALEQLSSAIDGGPMALV